MAEEKKDAVNPEAVQAQVTATQEVKKADFDPLAKDSAAGKPGSIDLIMDISLDVTVELGRTMMSVKDILALNVGSVIELDKMAGDPVDILVNGKLIAKGEVVVVDDNFGVRIISIISPSDRMNGLE